MKREIWMSVLSVVALASCREEPNPVDYTTHVGIREAIEGDGAFLPGPDPFVPGELRADLGIFYEGDASDVFSIDGLSRNYFIFELTPGAGDVTFTQSSSSERIEGLFSDEIALNGSPFWGAGIIYQTLPPEIMPVPEDFSAFDTMRVSLLSEDAGFADVEIEVQTLSASGRLDASEFGYVNDGEWHNLEIPLSAFVDDLTEVIAPFIIGGVGGSPGETLLVDNLYFEASAPE
ncbi:MAG: hypothetical protein ACFB9M_02845 [Myxococcota bacterium]